MQVHRDISHLPTFNNAVVTIGTFDGVHSGHIQIINQLKKEAKEINGETVIITFHPHPRMVIRKPGTLNSDQPYDEIKLLNTLSEKIELLNNQRIDHLVIVPFTLKFSEQSAEDYIADFLVSKFHPRTIIIGYDHKFGKDRSGDYRLLEQYQSAYNFTVKEIPQHVLHNVIISSTKIRHSLAGGDIATANEALGYSYFFEGRVIEGNKLGRMLGYPTANLEIDDKNKLIPAHGVYAVKVSISDEGSNMINYFDGMMNIGTRPTIDGKSRVIEVNIFEFNEVIYEKPVRVYVKSFLRPEVKFSGLEELKSQLLADKEKAEKILKN